MANAAPDVFDPYVYPWWAINYFLILWLSSHACRYFVEYSRLRESFISLCPGKQRNVTTYVLEIVFTTFALFAQFYGGTNVLFQNEDFPSQEEVQWMTLSLLAIVVIYVWELIFRQTFGWPLLIHHLATLTLVQLVSASYLETWSTLYIRGALIFGFYATTEQLSFVALFCYRMNILSQEQRGLLFLVAALTTLIIKVAITVCAIVFYCSAVLRIEPGSKWGTFWKISYLPLLGILFLSQLYACQILYALSCKCFAAGRSTNVDLETGCNFGDGWIEDKGDEKGDPSTESED